MKRSLVVVLSVALISALAPVSAPANGVVTLGHRADFSTSQAPFPRDVACDKWGTVFVVDSDRNAVQKYDGDTGAHLGSFATTGSGDMSVTAPFGLDTDRWGNVYVAEKGLYPDARVNMFTMGGFVHNRFYGDTGPAPGNLSNALRVAVDIDGDVLVADDATVVNRYEEYGSFVRSFNPTGNPYSVGVSVNDGQVYVCNDQGTPSDANKVVVYDPSSGNAGATTPGIALRSWGGTGSALGQFQRPYDIGLDPQDRVYVIEVAGQRGQVFTKDGAHLATFGSAGGGAGQFSLPYGLDVGLDRRVWVADTFNGRISSWDVTVSTEVTQVAGLTRYATSAAASRKAYPNGSDWVVVASGANWPDALGGASLCGVLEAPLLLTDPLTLSPETAAEITRLGASNAYVLGGTGAVSDDVHSDVEDLVHSDVVRLAGGSRYETAAQIASETVAILEAGDGYDMTAFVCTGASFADALAVAPIAAANGWPIYLTEPTTYTASTKAMMQAKLSHHGYVIGGAKAVSDDVLLAINQASVLWPTPGFGRVAGPTRYATAAEVAEFGFDGLGMLWSKPALANGQGFADALSGGVLQGSDYSVMILTPKDSLDPYAEAALTARRDMIYEMRFLGGTGAIAQPTRDAAAALLH